MILRNNLLYSIKASKTSLFSSNRSYHSLVRRVISKQTSNVLKATSCFLIHKRFMLKATKHTTEIFLKNVEIKQVAHTALALCNTLSTPNVVQGIATNNMDIASQNIHTYINSNHGTIQLRTTFLSTIGEHKFSLPLMVSHYNNKKLCVVSNDIKIPIRSVAELYATEQFTKRFDSHIESVNLTGDTIKFDTKKNPFQDIVSKFSGTTHSKSSTRTFDIKSGNFCKGEYFKGEIRQVTIEENGEIIWYPNKEINLSEAHYGPLTSRLKSQSFLMDAKSKMDLKQYDYFESVASKPHTLVLNNSSYQDIENALMDIQVLSTFPKAFNFVNIYTISKTTLTQKELGFIQEISQYINPHILNNPRNMQQFMLKALRIYRVQNEPNVFKIMKPLKATQEWLFTELDKLGTDIFI